MVPPPGLVLKMNWKCTEKLSWELAGTGGGIIITGVRLREMGPLSLFQAWSGPAEGGAGPAEHDAVTPALGVSLGQPLG